MKRFILVLSVISILFLAGCNLNENVENNNGLGSGDKENQQHVEENDSGEQMEQTEGEDGVDSNFILLNTKWQIRHLEDVDGNEKELDLHYGKAIHQYGYGSLEFNADGTFVEIYPGVSEGNGYGTYSLDENELVLTYENNYIKKGSIKVYNGIEQIILKDDNYTYYFNDIEYDFSQEEIKEELGSRECLYVTSAINNMNDTYTLKGIIYTFYTLTKEELNEIVKEGIMVLNNEIYEVDKLEDTNWDGYEAGAEYGLHYYWQNEKRVRYTIGKEHVEDDEYLILSPTQYPIVWKSTNIHKQITVNKNVVCEEGYTGEETTVDEYFSNFKKNEPIGDLGISFEFENGECNKIFLPYSY